MEKEKNKRLKERVGFGVWFDCLLCVCFVKNRQTKTLSESLHLVINTSSFPLKLKGCCSGDEIFSRG